MILQYHATFMYSVFFSLGAKVLTQGFSQLSESGGARLQIIPKVGGKKGKFKANMNDFCRKLAKWGGS